MGIESLGSVATGIGRGAATMGRGIGMGAGIGIGRSVVEGPARINLSGFRPMTIGDIGTPDLGGVVRPRGWAVTPRSHEIHHQVRIERYATIRENARAQKPMVSSMPQIEDIAAKAWKATERRPIKVEPIKVEPSYREVLSFWNEVRAQPDVTDEILERAHKAKNSLKNRRLGAMPQAEVRVSQPKEEPVSSPKSVSQTEVVHQIATKPQVISETEVKQYVKQKEEKKERKETPKPKQAKKGASIFKKDEPVSAYRLARAKEKFKILHRERNGGVVFGFELNTRLGGDEIASEQSTLLPQLGLRDRKDGTNIPGFRKTIGTLVFNSLKDGDRKIDEANNENIPVMIGGDGIVLPDEYAEKVLQEEREALIKVREILAKAA